MIIEIDIIYRISNISSIIIICYIKLYIGISIKIYISKIKVEDYSL